MNSFENLGEYIRENLRTVLAIGMLVLVALGDAYFVSSSLLPKWRARSELLAAQESAEASLNHAVQAQSDAPGQLQAQIDEMQASLDERANIFLSTSQANDVLNRLFGYAAESGVEIVEVQAKPLPPQEEEEASSGYDVSAFTLKLIGTSYQLMMFAGRIDETAVPGVVIDNLVLEEGEGQSILTLDILLYTSPYASGTSLAEGASEQVVNVAGSELLSLAPQESVPSMSMTPSPPPVCDCSGNLYNCRSFPDKESAQACYDFCGGPANDVHRLDRDLNGIACQTVFP